MMNKKNLHSLASFEDLKAVTGTDDRDAKLACFTLVSSTLAIERYCLRRLLMKKITDYPDCYPDDIPCLREYPVKRILAVYNDPRRFYGEESRVCPSLYYTIPEAGTDEDVPFFLAFRNIPHPGEKALKVKYLAGYEAKEVPADLKTACAELAAWNLTRYRGRRIGMTGSVRGRPGEGEHLEMSMPENVRLLLEPYRRKTI
jgi:hypothetical protein